MGETETEDEVYDLQTFVEWFKTISIDNEENDCSLGIFPVADPDPGVFESKFKIVDNGLITQFADDHGMVNHHIYFTINDIDHSDNSVRPSVGSRVNVRAVQKRKNGLWTACSLMFNDPDDQEDWDNNDKYRVPTSHEDKGFFIGLVESYDKIQEIWHIDGLQFSASDIIDGGYVPAASDWIRSKVEPGGKVSNVEPLRKSSVVGTVTRNANAEYQGRINEDVYFTLDVCKDVTVRYKDLVDAEVVECANKQFGWRAINIKILQRGRKDRNTDFAPEKDKSLWSYRGERPELPQRRSQIPSFLPEFPVPKNLVHRVRSGGDISALQPHLKEDLNWDNYVGRFSALLYLAEIHEEQEVNSLRINNVHLKPASDGFVEIKIPGIANNHPSIVIGDIIMLSGRTITRSNHQGYVHEVRKTDEKIYVSFHEKLLTGLKRGDRFTIRFSYSRIPFRRCQFAVRQVCKQRKNFLFVKIKGNSNVTEKIKEDKKNQNKNYDKKLNERQSVAIKRMQSVATNNLPYVLFGPPGTGKTVTLTELIIQLVNKDSKCRLLVCAPSNNAVDALCMKLHESGHVDPSLFTRFNSFRRPQRLLSDVLSTYCRDTEPLLTTVRYRIVFTTCVNAGSLFNCRLKSDHFTHVIIDEAAQCTEPESLIPIALAPHSKVVLAGDPMQLGSVVKSPLAKHFGLNISLMERLMNHELYQRDMDKYGDSGGYNARLVTKLTDNYRSHPSLLSLPSKLFYHDELVPRADSTVVDALVGWKKLPKKGIPLVFHAVYGEEKRDQHNPSYFNPSEVLLATQYAGMLVHDKPDVIRPSDIVIITPYRRQVQKMRLMLSNLSLEDVNVGSVEAFQGQESKVIIVSLVRSRESTKDSVKDPLSFLGFVSDPKRFNVAITRARSLLVVLGNPKVLSHDPHWKAFMEYCKEMGACTGFK